MSMNMYMMNLLNGVEALTTDLNLIEKEVQNNDDELLSIEGNITQIKTRMDETELNVSSIEATKQDKLNVLSTLNINKVNCNQVIIGTSDVSTEIDSIKNSFANKDYVDDSVLNNKVENVEYTDGKTATVKAECVAYTNYVSTMNKAQYENFTILELMKNKTESDAYTDSKVAGIDLSFINNYISSPSIDLAGKLLTDISIVNKLYIDQKTQQLWDSLNGFLNNDDFSIKGIHTVDLSSFDTFTTSIGAHATVKIASFRYSPKNSNSRHNCFFNTPYRFPVGEPNGTDSIRSYANVYQQGILKYQSYQPIQYFVGYGGGGTRSGVIFPLQFSVKPDVLNGNEITIEIYIRNDSDDQMQVERTEGTWFTCNEIRG